MKTRQEIEYQLKMCRKQHLEMVGEGRDGLAQLVKGWIEALEWVLEKR